MRLLLVLPGLLLATPSADLRLIRVGRSGLLGQGPMVSRQMTGATWRLQRLLHQQSLMRKV
jgi:hypothetical protein